MKDRSSKYWSVHAALGSAAWLGIAATNRTLLLLHLLFLLAPLTIVPLCIAHIGGRLGSVTQRILRVLLPVSACLVVVAVHQIPGWLAGTLSAPWLVAAVLVACRGLVSLLSAAASPMNRVAMNVACLFFPVGAIWLLASRLGVDFLGFSEPIVILTAVHFHFAGFATLVVAGVAYEFGATSEEASRRLYAGCVWGLILGMPLVAAGISTHPVPEGIAALIFSLALMGFGVFQLLCVRSRLEDFLPRTLLLISSLSVLFAMTMSIAYGLGRLFGTQLVTIPTMIETHGAVNAIGFVLCALLAYGLARSPGAGIVEQGK